MQAHDEASFSKFQIANAKALKGAEFEWRKWRQIRQDWTHDHCLICWAYIRENALPGDYSEAFATAVPTEPSEILHSDGRIYVPAPVEEGVALHWVCPRCFASFKEQFDWKVRK